MEDRLLIKKGNYRRFIVDVICGREFILAFDANFNIDLYTSEGKPFLNKLLGLTEMGYKDYVVADKGNHIIIFDKDLNIISNEDYSDFKGIIPNSNMFIFRQDNKEGIVSFEDGIINEIVPFIYDRLYYLKDNRFLAYRNSKVGVIDLYEKEIIPIVYDGVEVEGDRCIFHTNEYSDLYDFDGNVIYKANSILDVKLDYSENTEKLYLIDRVYRNKVLLDAAGNKLIDNLEFNIFRFVNGRYIIGINERGLYGVTDLVGNKIIDFNYEKINYVGGYFIVYSEGTFDLYDINMNKVFSEEGEVEHIGDRFLVLNKQDDCVITSLTDFRELYRIKSSFLSDVNRDILVFRGLNGDDTILNIKTGNIKTFELITPIDSGIGYVVRVCYGDKSYSGLIDLDFEEIVKPKYTSYLVGDVYTFSNDYETVLVDKTNKILYKGNLGAINVIGDKLYYTDNSKNLYKKILKQKEEIL